MKLAVMQPYLFPYIGYFQMIKAVDVFVFYDDVNFIKQGWINRNRILVSNKEYLFTVPLKNASSFVSINETFINLDFFKKWKKTFLQTIEQNYKKAPQFEEVFLLLNEIFEKNHITISQLAVDSVVTISKYLGIEKKFLISSEQYHNQTKPREERLIAICKAEQATQYINAIGGKELYTKESFKKEAIELSFIKSFPIDYKQFNNEFVSWLSIIDVLMFNTIEEVNQMLDKYELH